MSRPESKSHIMLGYLLNLLVLTVFIASCAALMVVITA